MDSPQIERFLSQSAREATRNEIRELLKLMARPEIISLAGGMPASETFPVAQLAGMLPEMLERDGTQALQYGPTEGDLELRRELLAWMVHEEGNPFARLTPEHLLVTSASQQGLDLCSRVFLSRGDAVICGLPSYLGALGAFTACGARLCGVPLDDDGMRVDLLEQRLVDLRRQGIRPKLLYTVPDFQNPRGVTLALERRRTLLAVAREFDLLVLEDSPYRQLRYVGSSLPTLFALDRDQRVISLFTFSKILFPGIRLGWVVASPEIIARLVVAKQPVDLCTSGLSQMIVREYLRAGQLPEQIRSLREIYAVKRATMLEALEKWIDPAWGVRWTRPEGGLFLWLTLPRGMDAKRLLQRAIEEEKIAFVIGGAFHCDGSGANTLRLNFSFPTLEQLRTAIERLARCIGSALAEQPELSAAREPERQEPARKLIVDGAHSLAQLAWNLALSETAQ